MPSSTGPTTCVDDPRARRPASAAGSARTRPCRRCSGRGRRRRCACDPAPTTCGTKRAAVGRGRSTTPPARRETLRARRGRRRRRTGGRPSPRRTVASARRAILGDHDALAGRQAVGLDDEREARAHRARSTSQRLLRGRADPEARRRHPVPRHEVLRERLARLERGGRPRRTDDRRGRPRRTGPTTPRLSGSSGPTTVRSTPSRSAMASRAAGSARRPPGCTGRCGRCRDCPGAQTTSTRRARAPSVQARACSRPPPPTTRIFMDGLTAWLGTGGAPCARRRDCAGYTTATTISLTCGRVAPRIRAGL